MRHGRRQFQPSVTGLEGRQLMSNAPLSTIATFRGSNQSVVLGPVMDAQGDLFVTTSGGGEGKGKADGAVFEIPAGTKKLTNLASFDGRTGSLISGVTLDNQGNLFGTISGQGGFIGNGSAFEIAAGTKTATTVASFNDYAVDQYGSQFPPNGVVADSQGDLFGTAAIGGPKGTASAFEIRAGSAIPVTIATFSGTAPAPKGLVMDAQGNLFGTNAGGGPSGTGSVYEIAKGSNTVTTLATFNSLNGAGISNVVIDGQGNLFGTTEDGGLFDDGMVFEIAKGSNTVTTLGSFDVTNGAFPDQSVGVTLDAQGNLFGTTRSGGVNSDGTVFEIAKGSNTITTLANFTSTNQALVSGLVADNQGSLFGTTDGSGTAGGTVFKVNLNIPPAKK
jgi:uncharacterized repeat protein (TIGR03803 family)